MILKIIKNYKEIIVKDGTDVFNALALFFVQCASHIFRYIKGIYDFVDHVGAKKMSEFLQKCIHERKMLIEKGVESDVEIELKKLHEEYDKIFKVLKKEWMKSSSDENSVYNDERKLLTRFETEKEKMKSCIFLKTFLNSSYK